MIIQLRKFGTTLVSRPSGKEALLAFQPTLDQVKNNETITVDFSQIITLSPSWADEFLTPLQQQFKNRIKFINTDNSSVQATLSILGLNI
jgi:hypothetical protein